MAQRSDIDRGREIIERWCALAEKRLDYLTDLFETGRWRRFHTEDAFRENIREAMATVETWRSLLSCEATRDNRPIDFAWLGRPAVPLAQRDIVQREGVSITVARPDAGEPITVAAPEGVVVESPSLEVHSGWERGLDLASIQQRYPLLRNAL